MFKWTSISATERHITYLTGHGESYVATNWKMAEDNRLDHGFSGLSVAAPPWSGSSHFPPPELDTVSQGSSDNKT